MAAYQLDAATLDALRVQGLIDIVYSHPPYSPQIARALHSLGSAPPKEKLTPEWYDAAAQVGRVISVVVDAGLLPRDGYDLAYPLLKAGLSSDELCASPVFGDTAIAMAGILYYKIFGYQITVADLAEEDSMEDFSGTSSTSLLLIERLRRKWASQAIYLIDEVISKADPGSAEELAAITNGATFAGHLLREKLADNVFLNSEISKLRDLLKRLGNNRLAERLRRTNQSNLGSIITTGVELGHLPPEAMSEAVELCRKSVRDTDIRAGEFASRVGRFSYALAWLVRTDPTAQTFAGLEVSRLFERYQQAIDVRAGNALQLRAFITDSLEYLFEWAMPIFAAEHGATEAIVAIEGFSDLLNRLAVASVPPPRPTLEELTSRLRPRQVAVYLIGGRHQVRALILDHKGKTYSVEFPELDGDAVGSLVADTALRGANGRGDDSALRSALDQLWFKFGVLLVSSFESRYELRSAIERIVILPQGVLSSVPFLAARSFDSEFELDDLVLATQSVSLAALPAVPAGDNLVNVTISGGAADLTYLESDIAAISRLATPQPVVSSSKFSEVISNLTRARQAFFCGHGSSSHHTGSEMLLRDGSSISGQTISDLIPRVQRDYAFLNLCESSRTGTRSPAEAIGLPNALLGVGFDSVIGTYWKVQDLESHLMLVAFLDRRSRHHSESISETLQYSKRFLRTQSELELLRWVEELGFVSGAKIESLRNHWNGKVSKVPLRESLDISAFAVFGLA